MRCKIPTILALSSILMVPTGAALAQGLDVKAQVLADLETMESKFTDLAAAMEAGQYAWRPMEGVRSVSEVFMLIAAENYYIPAIWDADAANGAVTFETMNSVTDKGAVIEHLKQAFAHCSKSIATLTDADLEKKIDFFGRERTVAEAILAMTGDMHEHLGQAIAYARTNHVVPPWSASGGM